ncbi:MAG: hypothetical protein NTX65_14870 [Ignavibacteriales bacterium]|nr:hypothetical protein [Ignavibacteriales bacterium]
MSVEINTIQLFKENTSTGDIYLKVKLNNVDNNKDYFLEIIDNVTNINERCQFINGEFNINMKKYKDFYFKVKQTYYNKRLFIIVTEKNKNTMIKTIVTIKSVVDRLEFLQLMPANVQPDEYEKREYFNESSIDCAILHKDKSDLSFTLALYFKNFLKEEVVIKYERLPNVNISTGQRGKEIKNIYIINKLPVDLYIITTAYEYLFRVDYDGIDKNNLYQMVNIIFNKKMPINKSNKNTETGPVTIKMVPSQKLNSDTDDSMKIENSREIETHVFEKNILREAKEKLEKELKKMNEEKTELSYRFKNSENEILRLKNDINILINEKDKNNYLNNYKVELEEIILQYQNAGGRKGYEDKIKNIDRLNNFYIKMSDRLNKLALLNINENSEDLIIKIGLELHTWFHRYSSTEKGQKSIISQLSENPVFKVIIEKLIQLFVQLETKLLFLLKEDVSTVGSDFTELYRTVFSDPKNFTLLSIFFNELFKVAKDFKQEESHLFLSTYSYLFITLKKKLENDKTTTI